MGKGLADLLGKKSQRGTGAKSARVFTLPAPTGGLNRNASFSGMKQDEAIILDNLIVKNGVVRTRGGWQETDPSIGSAVNVIQHPWLNNGLIYLTNSGIYEFNYDAASTSTWISLAGMGGWQLWTHFSTTGGDFMVFAGGGKGIMTYSRAGVGDTTTWNAGISGSLTTVTVLNVVGIGQHAERLWLWTANSTDLHYLPVASMTGVAKKLPIGQFLQKGGNIVGVKSWTRDGGDGLDDYLCVFTDSGEVVVYQGYDPDDPDNWQKVGTFDIGMPNINLNASSRYMTFARQVLKVGGDIGIITTRGIAMMSELAQTNVSGHEKISITHKISALFLDAIGRTSGSGFERWYITEFPKENCLIIGHPITVADGTWSGSGYAQFVLSLDTDAWTRWFLPAKFATVTKEGRLFFDTQTNNIGRNNQYLTETPSDNGGAANIKWRIQTCFTTMKTTLNKSVSQVRPYINCSLGYTPVLELRTNFENLAFVGSGNYTDIGKSVVDTNDNNNYETIPNNHWVSISGEGTAFSLCMSGEVCGYFMELHGIDFLFEPEDIL